MISDLTPHPVLTKLAWAFAVATVVVPAWRQYILVTVLRLAVENTERRTREEQNRSRENGRGPADPPVARGSYSALREVSQHARASP